MKKLTYMNEDGGGRNLETRDDFHDSCVFSSVSLTSLDLVRMDSMIHANVIYRPAAVYIRSRIAA